MNTRQRIKGHWIKKSILATLLMGICYLLATIDIDQIGRGIEQWGENLGRSAEEAGGSIGDAIRSAANSDAAHAAANQARRISEWAKNEATTETPMTEIPKPPTVQPIKPVAPIKSPNIAS